MSGPGLTRRLRHYLARLVLFGDYVKVSLAQASKTLPENDKKIVCVLDHSRLYRDDDGSGRHAYLILNLFSDAGYTVYFYKKITFGGFLRLSSYGRLIYSIPNVKFISKISERTEEMIYAFDDEADKRGLLKHSWKKMLYINVEKPLSCTIGRMIWIPYGMHPLLYSSGCDKKLNDYRAAKKKVRTFFGGNVSPVYYRNPKLRGYGQLTRMEGVEALLNSGSKVREFENSKQFESMLSGEQYFEECLLLKTDNTFRIHPSDWLNLVSKADFFICLSGTCYPMCHNAFESLAVGTIPIISYADWFYPPLEHKKNALVYDGTKEDLVKKVQESLGMSTGEIAQMRENVICYYEENLTSQSFVRQIRSAKEKILTLMLHPRYIHLEADHREDGRIIEDFAQTAKVLVSRS